MLMLVSSHRALLDLAPFRVSIRFSSPASIRFSSPASFERSAGCSPSSLTPSPLFFVPSLLLPPRSPVPADDDDGYRGMLVKRDKHAALRTVFSSSAGDTVRTPPCTAWYHSTVESQASSSYFSNPHVPGFRRSYRPTFFLGPVDIEGITRKIKLS